MPSQLQYALMGLRAAHLGAQPPPSPCCPAWVLAVPSGRVLPPGGTAWGLLWRGLVLTGEAYAFGSLFALLQAAALASCKTESER